MQLFETRFDDTTYDFYATVLVLTGSFWDIFEREVWAGGHLYARLRVDLKMFRFLMLFRRSLITRVGCFGGPVYFFLI